MRPDPTSFGMLVLAVAVATAGAWGQESPAPPPVATPTPTPAPAPASARGMLVAGRAEAETALLESLLPKPMSRERFARLLSAIDPSLATNAMVTAAHDLYLDRVREASRSVETAVAGRVPAAFTFDPAEQSFEPRYTPELVELLSARARAADATSRAEAVLVRGVESETPADARRRIAGALEAWRMESLPRRGLLASTETAIGELVARIPLEATVEVGVGQVVAAHAARVAALLGERLELLRANESERARIESAAGPLWRLGADPAARAATEAALAQLYDRDYANERAIRDERLDALRQLRLRMPAREGRRLVEAWQRAVHPELFDDERLLAELVEASIASNDLADDARVLLLDTVEQGYRRIEPLAEKCSLAADALEPRLLDRTTFGVVAEIGARMSLLDAQLRRRRVVRETFERIRLLLPVADAASRNEVRRRRDAFVVALDALDRADTFERDALARLAVGVAEAGMDAAAPSSEGPGSDAIPGKALSSDASSDSATGAGFEAPPSGARGSSDAGDMPRRARGSRRPG